MRSNQNGTKLEDALVDLYLSLKVNKTENSDNERKKQLKLISPLTLLHYIKESIEILINLKIQEKVDVNPLVILF